MLGWIWSVWCDFLKYSGTDWIKFISIWLQFIAGIVEHRVADEFASQTFFVNMLSFVVRTLNSYWATLVCSFFSFFFFSSIYTQLHLFFPIVFSWGYDWQRCHFSLMMLSIKSWSISFLSFHCISVPTMQICNEIIVLSLSWINNDCSMLQQWVDLARFTGLQSRKDELPPYQDSDSPTPAALECTIREDTNIDEIQNQWGDTSHFILVYEVVIFP